MNNGHEIVADKKAKSIVSVIVGAMAFLTDI